MSDEEQTSEVIVTKNIEEEMKESYLRYSMSVIISRALPDVRDGLKPSQRRILYAMRQLSLSPGGKHRKCAKIAGDTSGDFHPHGEGVIYPTLVRMAQDWVMRYSLVNGQGNFGSVDGDPPAAMRYTEARLTGPSMSLMDDLDKETVDYVPNYDETKKEPVVFPSRFPNLLCNGSTGIAVGMATNIPPHNLCELIDATSLVIDNPETTVDEIMAVMPGPDFPTGGIICGIKGIKEAYHTGRGKLRVRGVFHIEELKGDRSSVVLDELPFGVNKATLIIKIAELVNNKQMTGVSDIRDESDRQGLRVVLDLKRGEIPDVIVNQLYKFTDFQVTFGCNMLALDNGLPRVMNVKHMITCWIDHRVEVVRRRTRFELKKAESRAHLLEGYLKALDKLDEIVNLIKKSADKKEARVALIAKYMLSERQADAVLELRLYQLTGLERAKIEKEYAELLAKIKHLQAILASSQMVFDIIKGELDDMRKYDKKKRLTTIAPSEEEGLEMEDLIANEPVIITISTDDYIKRMPIDTFREQKRGGSGVIGIDMKKDADGLKDVYVASTHDHLLVFSSFGRCYWLKAWQIPEGSRRSKGKALVNLLEGFAKEEEIAAVLRVSNFEQEASILLATKNGVIKKTLLDSFSSPRRKGVYAISIDEGDKVISAKLVKETDQIMLFTRHGMAVRFDQSLVRAMGRTARGVRGVSLKNADDFVVSCVVVNEGHSLLVVCEHGHGKRSKVVDFRQTNRGGKGVRSIITNKRNGLVVGAITVTDADSALMMSNAGQTLRTSMKDIRIMGRSTQGVKIVQLGADDYLVGLQRIENIETEAEKKE
ncbi:MAG: DNA gyrase subunit A [Chlamydiia bacterium]|nr:DNA gyrase subunit A [Chlamydiia bacterium]MCH9618105.1 DNA gyrase subunit A [Chlamydiia bacterium]MCH9623985.1 DNA gyrase subunit A [Chlamydiia bacterium]